MPNQIIPVRWGKPLRKSEVNTLDKVNELVDFINNSDIHELDLIASDQGREVITGTSTQLAQLEVYGESVQNGTPTPDNPVPVQVVGGRNLIPYPYEAGSGTYNGVTATIGEDGRISISGTATANVYLNLIAQASPITLAAGAYTLSATGLVGSVNMTLGHIVGSSGQYLTAVTAAVPTMTITFEDVERIFGYVYIPNGTTINATLSIQLEAGTQATPYTPYGCIGLQVGENITPIDLQGNVLASLPDGTRDILNVNSAGVVTLDKHVGGVDLGTLDWYYGSGRFRSVALSDADSGTARSVIMCSHYEYAPSGSNDGTAFLYGPNIYVYNNAYTDPTEFKTVMSGVLLYYELATSQTIELGTIDPPAIPSGSVVKIVATLQPEFTLAWFTEHGLPLAINDMRDYVDAKISEVNARIDELHGITRANLEIQSIPVDDDTENESDTEVTENER